MQIAIKSFMVPKWIFLQKKSNFTFNRKKLKSEWTGVESNSHRILVVIDWVETTILLMGAIHTYFYTKNRFDMVPRYQIISMLHLLLFSNHSYVYYEKTRVTIWQPIIIKWSIVCDKKTSTSIPYLNPSKIAVLFLSHPGWLILCKFITNSIENMRLYL